MLRDVEVDGMNYVKIHEEFEQKCFVYENQAHLCYQLIKAVS